MAVLYTSKVIKSVLQTLHIKPIGGYVSSKEAAAILTWRASAEEGITHIYTPASVRRHVHTGNLVPRRVSPRLNRYKVEDVFALHLAPKRGRHNAA